jgi:acyl carrier protein
MQTKKQEIIYWLEEWFKKKNDSWGTDDKIFTSKNYFEEGWIDSLGIMYLIMEIEKKFAVKFTENHFQDRRFPTITGLSEIILEILN